MMLGEEWSFLCKGFDALDLDWAGQMDPCFGVQ
jgi:hypothetical protein